MDENLAELWVPRLVVTECVLQPMTYLLDGVQVFNVLLFRRNDLMDNPKYLQLSNMSC